MSRIGRKKISIPDEVKVEQAGSILKVAGPLGSLEVPIHDKVRLSIVSDEIAVERTGEDKLSKSLHGTTRALIANAITGVKDGYEKRLEIVGVGYRASIVEGVLILKVGYSHEVNMPVPESLAVEVKKNIVSIKGIDKQKVGQFSAEVRSVRKPEPYKGKGIKYVDERIIRKAGKAVKGATAPGA